MPRQKLRSSLLDRFNDKVSPEPNSGCWLWTGGITELGYGVIGLGRREEGTDKAHRVSWRLHRGPIPDGMCVCHRCDTPLCVNPDHLFLGTLGDNMRDCVRKARNYVPNMRGSRAPWSRLTEEQVSDILTRRLTSLKFAALYGVSGSAIREIWRGKNWKSHEQRGRSGVSGTTPL
jgi:hypothetical protein